MYWWQYRANISLYDNKNQNGMKIAINRDEKCEMRDVNKEEDINANKRGDPKAS